MIVVVVVAWSSGLGVVHVDGDGDEGMVVVEKKEAMWHHLGHASQIWQAPGRVMVLSNNFY